MIQLKFIKRIFILFFVIFFTHISSALASSITLSDFSPTSITSSDQEVSVKVNLSINSDDGTIYYLRGVFAKDDSNNYCGYTWNGSDWFSGPYSTNEGWKKFLSVTISSQSATTTLKAKLDLTDSGCKESGNYKFKVQRFTTSSDNGYFDGQNIQTVSVTLPTFTPTPNPTSTPAPTSPPSSTPYPTSTPKPTVKILPTSRPTIFSDGEGLDKKASPTRVKITDSTEVLGESTQNNEASVSASSKSSPFVFVWILIGLGGLCLAFSGCVFIYSQKKKNKI